MTASAKTGQIFDLPLAVPCGCGHINHVVTDSKLPGRTALAVYPRGAFHCYPREETQIRIARRKPGLKRQEIADSELSGLYRIAQPSGKASWATRYRFEGRSRKLTLGDADKISVKDARILAKKAALSVASGVDPAAEKKRLRIAERTPADLDKVETVAATFIKRHVAGLAPATQREVNRIMEKEIVRAWRGRKLSTIGKPEIHNLLDSITDRGAPIYANRVLMWLRALSNFAIGRGLIEVNPCVGIDMPAAEIARDRVLSDSELTALWEAAGALPSPYGAFVFVLTLTGQRRNEVSEMVWPEMDFAAKLWTLPGSRAKNGKEHSIPLSDAAIAILKAIPRIKGCDAVFTVNGRNPIKGHHLVKRRLDKLMPKETPPWVLHDVRRTVATGMASLGVALPVVEKLLNHVSGSFAGIVGVYQRHDYAEQKRVAMELWAGHVKAIVSGMEADNIVPMHHGR